MKIVSNRYGKRRVRVLKVLREGPRHTVVELDAAVLLTGDFDTSYAAADNGLVVPTDTVKNTITVLAHRKLGREIERFGLELTAHFLAKYPQVKQVEAELRERPWERQTVEGKAHDHAFSAGPGAPFVRVTAKREAAPEVESGVDDWLILKSTGSGFSGYPKCEYTTLPETADRILATSVRAGWTWGQTPADFRAANAAVRDAMFGVFARNYSRSVQGTMHEMAAAAFEAVPGVRRIALALPNKHYLPANLKPFGLENPNVTFVPTDEPHGQIEAVFER